MSNPQHSLRNLQRDFTISAGTQVVVKVAKVLPGGEEYKPAGSVGVVIEAPPSNREPYVVRFADGVVAKAYFDELALRRREVDDVLGHVDDDLRPYVIYRCQVGSKAFGLASADSDDDLRGIYLPPARLHWSLRRLPEQLEFQEGDRDEVYWELEKFLRLALKANPNVLETLWTPVVLDADETVRELRQTRRVFLSKHVYKTYSGYVLSQFRRMANAYEKKGTFKSKHAMHLIRLLLSGITVLREGLVPVRVDDHRDQLIAIRDGRMDWEDVNAWRLELHKEFETTFATTNLPDRPDYDAANAFLVRARRSRVQ